VKVENCVEVINIDKVLRKRIIETPSDNKYCIEIKLTSYGKRLIVSKLKGKAVQKDENN
jgi:hypothetical protein